MPDDTDGREQSDKQRRPDEQQARKRVFRKRLRTVLAAGAVAAAGFGLALLKGKKPRS